MKTTSFYNLHKIPMQIPVVFNKNNFILWTSKKLNPNHFVFYTSENLIYILNQFFKNEINLQFSYLLENSAIDTLNYFNIMNISAIFFKKNRFLVFYSYYFYNIKTRLTLISTCNNKNKSIQSIDTIFKNASWLERETSEMYGIYFLWKTDIRKLLLDYSKNDAPLLKDFPVCGYQDYFYNILEDTVSYYNTEIIEL